eukprot:NODE_4119_length_695_cov_166.185759_g3492_i0.p4 GENE.NODE_4119_length_695_cov_166.185759_g3492_i0~~NODE_4119_length_695_cov_166.185759_g3492_i0.p4  ORF type:complete len:53 (+),score=3.97 NODE_4119_length_695_cov_166.185759_g3492_i0:340-498(+)
MREGGECDSNIVGPKQGKVVSSTPAQRCGIKPKGRNRYMCEIKADCHKVASR